MNSDARSVHLYRNLLSCLLGTRKEESDAVPLLFSLFLSAAILVACGQSGSPLSPTATGSVATVGSGSQFGSAARKNTAKFTIHVFSTKTGEYLNGALVTAVGSDGVPQSAETSPPQVMWIWDVAKTDASFDVQVTKEGYCPKDVVVPNEQPRWLWIGIQPEPGC